MFKTVFTGECLNLTEMIQMGSFKIFVARNFVICCPLPLLQ
jgi:hypothetical protein